MEKKRKKGITIPRLELLGCFVGSRLANSVIESLCLNTPIYFWSDSTTALAWIRRNEDYGSFVHNRVKDIRKWTEISTWRHVPGHMNPADLPSRGCSPRQLLESKWWEGPDWLKDRSNWPRGEAPTDETNFGSKLKKFVPPRNTQKLEKGMLSICCLMEGEEVKCSSYMKIIRIAAWARRFIGNCQQKLDKHITDFLTKDETLSGERDVLFEVQKIHFGNWPEMNNVACVKFKDGLLRVESRLFYKSDVVDFKFPILLPKGKDSLVVRLLILYVHRSHGHAGIQFVLGKLRERYWILSGKRSVRNVIATCVICRRYRVKPMTTTPAALPATRVECQFAFQNTGVDLTGPLTLKGGDKVWIVLYTCAVYRGVHLDLVDSLSTQDFINSLERIVSILGRPNDISSDNGTNFLGAKGIMDNMDWEKLQKECQVKQIQWTFNPPAAPHPRWGGFWQRMVRTVKDLLKRMLKNSKLTRDELLTCVYTVAGIINDCPLTALSENADDQIPLTPRMLMGGIPIGVFPEGEEATGKCLRDSYYKLSAIESGLQARFRKEYLSNLIQHLQEKASEIKVGDVVLVGMEDKRRFLLPLARVVHLFPGKDGEPRITRIQITNKSSKRFGTHLLHRPVKKLYPLENPTKDHEILPPRGIKNPTKDHEILPPRGIQDPLHFSKKGQPDVQRKQKGKDASPSKVEPSKPIIATRTGRIIKPPQRYGTWNF